MSSFEGSSFHSAKWPKGYDVKGKNVAVIGTGASAVQIIPSIADEVQSLTVFQRSPAWVPKRHNWHYPNFLKWLFAIFPPLMTLHRYAIFCFDEISFPWLTYTETNKFWIKKQIYKWMKSTYDDVKDPEIRKKLTPTYEIGCKRITPHPNYVKTFNKPNVRLVTNRIEEITKGG